MRSCFIISLAITTGFGLVEILSVGIENVEWSKLLTIFVISLALVTYVDKGKNSKDFDRCR